MLGFLSLQRPKNYLKQWIQLLSNPTSFYVALILSLQATGLVAIAIFIPIGIRWLVLPWSVQKEIPLNLVFMPCEENLHGICSFPTAQINLQEMSLFSPSEYYQISVRLHFSEAETNFNIGMFQNELTLSDFKGTSVGHWRRTGLLKQPGYFTKALWILFFPLYFLGYFHNYNILEIPMVGEYYASADRMAETLNYALQDRFAQVDMAYLIINAKFGLIRNFIYYWPITSFLIMFAATIGAGLCVMTIFWGHKSYKMYKSSHSQQASAVSSRRASEVSTRSRTSTASTVSKESEIVKRLPATDEFIPDNVDEVPECPTLSSDFPVWKKETDTSVPAVIPLGLRNRKDKTYYT